MNLLEIGLYSLGFIVLLILTQDVHIYPGAFMSKVKALWPQTKRVPPQVESIFIPSENKIDLEAWRYAPEETTEYSDYVVVICHGNGGPVEHFLFYQIWFAELGIASYNFDYRGFGRSSGWPSERGIYSDTDAIWKYVCERESIDPSRIIVVGISVGSGPAARLASIHQPKMLLLSSAFTDLRSTVRAQPIVGLLWPFVWSKFPTIDFVKQLDSTHLVIAHGLKDNIVPSIHSEKLESAYAGSGTVERLKSDIAGHNMTFYNLKDELKASISRLL